jgi:hypothetical protein
MPSYGPQTLQTVGNARQLIASGLENVRWKVGGITMDWATVPAVTGSDVVLLNGTVIKVGEKYLPMGTIVSKITVSGKYGPARTNAADGREVLTRSECFLLNEDISENAPASTGAIVQGMPSDHPPVFDGGTIWKSLLKVGGTNEVTLANFLIAFPAIDFASM